MSSIAPTEDDPLALERDMKFKKWLQNKSVKEKAFEYLAKLDSGRATKEETLIEVGVALAAVDRLLGDDQENEQAKKKKAHEDEDNPYGMLTSLTKKKPSTKKTLKTAWMRWAMEHYNFDMLHLSRADVASLSDAVKEFLFSEADLMASSGASSEEIARCSKEKSILPSLKYFFPAQAAQGDAQKAKPLSKDQKAQNAIFTRELRALWTRVTQELDNVLVEFVGKGMKGSSGSNATPRKLETACLHSVSLGRLRAWLEEDEDAKVVKESETALDKLKQAKNSHEQFVKKKDSLRIRLPADYTPPVPPSFSFARTAPPPGPSTALPNTTTPIYLPPGSKYIHATGRGRQGVGGDLERRREDLLRNGFVSRENFDSQDVLRYEKEKAVKDKAQTKAASEALTAEAAAKAYEDWIKVKEMREQALKCLGLLAKPSLEEEKDNLRASGSRTLRKSGRSMQSSQSTQQLLNGAIPADLLNHIIDVGKALKSIDRTLLGAYTTWAEGVCSASMLGVMWDYYSPRACDVHSLAYTQTRDALAKLLKPNVDYKSAFLSYVEAKVIHRRIAAFKEEKQWSQLEGQDALDAEDELDALKEEWIKDIKLSKLQVNDLLVSLGVKMSSREMRVVVDSFDLDGDGEVSLKEFLDFLAPLHKHSALSKCVYLTSCKITGMSNAFTVSAPTKRWLQEEEEYARKHQSDASGKRIFNKARLSALLDQPEGKEDGSTSGNANVVVKQLANGEKRICVEIAERKRREDVLRRLGLLSPSKTKKKAKDPNDYEDDYEDNESDHYSSDGDHGPSPSAAGGPVAPCEASGWGEEQRRKGLAYLRDLTKLAREEALLTQLVTSGSPPTPPRLWAKYPEPEDREDSQLLDSQMMSGTGNMDQQTASLELFWAPQGAKDLVSFYSLEMLTPGVASSVDLRASQMSRSGLLGTGQLAPPGPAAAPSYKEIFRDPVEAGLVSQFVFTTLVPSLLPGTSYTFRVRAFNGFGPSGYAYGKFTTRPAKCKVPRIIRVSPDSVTLQWVFTTHYLTALKQLRGLFRDADRDGSGKVDREELAAILEDNTSTSLRDILSSLGYTSWGVLFDSIEGDDDGGLCWEEFQGFFGNMGFLEAKSKGGASKGVVKAKEVTYVVEKCENEFDSIYSEVLRTTSPYATITRLEPGQSYRFRVHGVATSTASSHTPDEVEEVKGPASEPVIVHTLLETPAVPVIKAITSNSVHLCWRPRNLSLSTRSAKFINKMVGDWTHSDGLGAGGGAGGATAATGPAQGVSIEQAFMKYDSNHSGDIDARELESVLADLGVTVTNERLSAAFALLDANGDGVISYEEFAAWWKRDEVSYLLKRSESLPFRLKTTARVDSGTAASTAAVGLVPRQVAVPIVVYRDTATSSMVQGLSPNAYYVFRLRYLGSRSNSSLSTPCAVLTAPLPPSVPVLVDCSSVLVRMKWYPGRHGCFKFLLCIKFPKTVKPIKGSTDMGDGFHVLYNGPDTLYSLQLAPGDYEVRAVAVNYLGTPSTPSGAVKFTITRPEGAKPAVPSPAQFTIECVGDICVGDTIIITERLFLRPSKGTQPLPAAPVAPRGGLNTSMTSIQTTATVTPSGTFIGERTLACTVLKDNYRTIRDAADGPTAGRRLWLEIVWCRLSAQLSKYALPVGDVIERTQADIEKFEVFRIMWKQEALRRPLQEEWSLLADCYVSVE